MSFRLSPEVTLPTNAATSTFAYLGTRGSGKTYGAGVMVEEFLGAGVQVVVVDPVGVWWALRVSSDGKGRGFDIPVFGGIHGDVPLEPTGGELVARLVVEHGISIVLDVSDFTDGQQRRFVGDFARALFQLKKRNRSPIHLLFEEAHEFFPQVVDAAAAPMVGATKRLWKVGRNYGIGGSLISTRAAEINKNALNISDVVTTGRLTAPEDVKRIKDWASSNGVNAEQVAQLPGLPKGRLIVWREPDAGGAVVTTFRKKTTFDASRTPEAGETQRARGLPAVDLVAIREAMAATIEEAKANDPKALQEEVARLRRELAGANAGGAAEERDRMAAEVDRLQQEAGEVHAWIHRLNGATPEEVEHLREMEGRFHQVLAAVEGYIPDADGTATTAPATNGSAARQRVGKLFKQVKVHIDKGSATPAPTPQSARSATRAPLPARAPASPSPTDDHGDGDGSVRMLRALAGRHPTPLTKAQLGTLSILKPKGGSFRTYLSKLVVSGLVVRDGVFVRLTPEGVKRAGPVDRPEGPRELLAMWRGKLGGKARDMLEVFAEGAVLSKAQLADRVDLDVAGGSFRTYLSKLRANGLIERAPGGMKAVESLVLR